MSSKIKLGNPPKSFSAAVSIPVFDGTEQINIRYIYRRKTEYAQLMDAFTKEIQKPKKQTEKANTMHDVVMDTINGNVDFVLKIAEGWDLSDEFNASNIAKLDDEYPGAIKAIIDTYEKALFEGRVKN